MKKIFSFVITLAMLISSSNIGLTQAFAEENQTEMRNEIETVLEETHETEIVEPIEIIEEIKEVEVLVFSDEVIEEIVEEVEEEIVEETTESESSSSVATPVVCTDANSPVVTFDKDYIEVQPGGTDTLLYILTQIQETASDLEDGFLSVSNNLEDLYPFTPGIYDIEFTAVDTDGCEGTGTVTLFVLGFIPTCEIEEVFGKITFDESLVEVYLGGELQIFSDQWFPMTHNGLFFNEAPMSSPAGTAGAYRFGSELWIKVGTTTEVSLANDMLDSFEVFNGNVTGYFIGSGGSGNFTIFLEKDIQPCVIPCDASNTPVLTINSDYMEFDLAEGGATTLLDFLVLLNYSAVDSEGNPISSSFTNLEEVYANFTTPGTYSLGIIATDGNGCEVFGEITIVIEDDGDGCPECGGPVCTIITKPTINIVETEITVAPGLTLEEIEALLTIELSDPNTPVDDLIETNNLSIVITDINVEGTYVVTFFVSDETNCNAEDTVTIVIEEETNNPPEDCTVNCGGGGGGTPPEPEPEPEVLGTSTCTEQITTYIKIGETNDVEEVEILQEFLNNNYGENLVVDGIYGIKTYEAVKRFQLAEKDAVLTPWGLDDATGYVYVTTQIHLNNLMCEALSLEIPELVCPNGEIVYVPGIGYIGHGH
jgi:hypothetical protein